MLFFNRLFIFLMLGFFALTAGCFILFLRPYDLLFRQKSTLQDGGEIFEIWRKPDVDLYVKIYIFNVTNAEDYMSGKDTKIRVKEIGPYVYKEALEHKLTRFNDNNTLSAIPLHPLTWMDELSEGNKEDDILFLPHIALLSIANVASTKNFVTRFGLNNVITLTNSQPLTKMTAREFMMGHESQLMTLGNTFMPSWIYFNKLGLIDRMYDFNGDYETVFTGEDDVKLSGLLDTYRGSTDLPHWEGKHCSNVQYASDGAKFRGGISANETILFYRKSLCRAAPLIPIKEGVKSGLKAYKYTFPDNMMDNGEVIKENKCFCRNGRCLPNGLIDVAECYYGFPIALSYPHFHKGNNVLFSKVEGLRPDPKKHESKFWIQPESGLPLDVSTKFQINMALGDISMIKNTEKFANLYLPLLWFDITMNALPPSLEQRFKLYINILPVVEKCAMYLFFVIGSVLILVTVYILTFKVMFKSFDGNKSKSFVTNMWLDSEKNPDVYAPCEVPLNEDSNSPDDRSATERLKDFSYRMGDKVYDTVNNVKEKVTEFGSVKHIFEKRHSKADVGIDDDDAKYQIVNQSDTDDDYKYLEVVDDGSGFDAENNDVPKSNNLILHID